jgi:hypothetical protein
VSLCKRYIFRTRITIFFPRFYKSIAKTVHLTIRAYVSIVRGPLIFSKGKDSLALSALRYPWPSGNRKAEGFTIKAWRSDMSETLRSPAFGFFADENSKLGSSCLRTALNAALQLV